MIGPGQSSESKAGRADRRQHRGKPDGHFLAALRTQGTSPSQIRLWFISSTSFLPPVPSCAFHPPSKTSFPSLCVALPFLPPRACPCCSLYPNAIPSISAPPCCTRVSNARQAALPLSSLPQHPRGRGASPARASFRSRTTCLPRLCWARPRQSGPEGTWWTASFTWAPVPSTNSEGTGRCEQADLLRS